MKRILCTLLSIICILSAFSLNISAEANKFEKAIEYCLENELISEEEMDVYFGEDNADLGSVLLLISRMAQADLSSYIEDESDIKDAALEWAQENGIIEGSADLSFDAESDINREQFALIISNYTAFLGIEMHVDENVLEDYKDTGDISEWALDSMKFALTNDILKDGEVVSPKDSLSSGELAQALMNFDKKVDVKPEPEKSENKEEKNKEEESSIFMTVTESLSEGFFVTLKLFTLTLLFALPLGLIFSFASMSKIKLLKWFMKTFIWIIRGTPLMLQLIIIYYGPGLVGVWAQGQLAQNGNYLIEWLSSWHTLDRFLAALIAFVINYACYFSEIFRGGIESISRGQYEAGQVLGMTKIQVFFRVVLLQVIKRIIAPMSNEIITLVKDTSLARTIAVYEVIWAGQSFIKSDGLLWPLFYTAVFYLLFCGLLTILFGKLEKKLSYFRG